MGVQQRWCQESIYGGLPLRHGQYLLWREGRQPPHGRPGQDQLSPIPEAPRLCLVRPRPPSPNRTPTPVLAEPSRWGCTPAGHCIPDLPWFFLPLPTWQILQGGQKHGFGPFPNGRCSIFVNSRRLQASYAPLSELLCATFMSLTFNYHNNVFCKDSIVHGRSGH